MAVFWVSQITANNLQISNLTVDESGRIQFKISWQNAWNLEKQAPFNHDAVWIFIKIKEKEGPWQTLETNRILNLQFLDANLRAEISSENLVGFIVFSSDTGNYIEISDEISFTVNDLPSEYAIKVMAIEMVYVPDGPFYLGDGISYNSFVLPSDSTPVNVMNESPMELSAYKNQSQFYFLPETYPKGTKGFYAMKYEISQAQYLDFLNSLTFEQQVARTIHSPSSVWNTLAMSYNSGDRNGIVVSVAGENPDKPAVYECNGNFDNQFSQEGDAQYRAANYLSWADLAAYLDWAGLRPLSELEYEKLCRGAQSYTGGELAWGSINGVSISFMLNDGFSDEKADNSGDDTTGMAHFGYSLIQGPVRVGFAATSAGKRIQAGAGYYGAFDLSGNVWEMLVSAAFTGFQAINGDGLISSEGYSDQAAWPTTDASGTIYRGGAWNSGLYEIGGYRDLAVSDRFYIDLLADMRRSTTGGRGGLSW